MSSGANAKTHVLGCFINQVFRRKNLVIKMMNIGGRASTIRFRSLNPQPLEIF